MKKFNVGDYVRVTTDNILGKCREPRPTIGTVGRVVSVLLNTRILCIRLIDVKYPRDIWWVRMDDVEPV